VKAEHRGYRSIDRYEEEPVSLLTIGEFAKAARLSPKALRLYDDLGLLRPAAVDPQSGYRYYDPEQLERARLVAWLRRIGMPLARIRTVCDLPPAAAAEDVARYWAQVLAETAGRERLATFLVDYLSGKGSPVSDVPTNLAIRYAARSDSGMVRTSNEDTAYAGGRLLAVADGMRGPGGDRASAAAIEALKSLDSGGAPAADLLNALADAVAAADRTVRDIAEATAADTIGTTLTAMLWSGSQLALVHIGDTRVYLLRGGELCQITHDHTYVQSLIDEGRLTPAEALSHPQRALLVRALDGTGRMQPDLSLQTAQAGDRYVLCSDGLSTVVSPESLRETLSEHADPDRTVERLIELAYQGGAPDNIACVVADVVQV
jgi:serine/threonine protein phosphatase PrpC